MRIPLLTVLVLAACLTAAGQVTDSAVRANVLRWKPVMETVNAGRLLAGRSGVDISPMVARGVPGFGLDPENHR